MPGLLLLALAASAWSTWTGRSRRATLEDESPAATPGLVVDEAFDPEGPAVTFLEQRVAGDALDFMARNKLAGLYLGGLEQTGDLRLLERAAELARESLEQFPAAVNTGGLSVMTSLELASHEFERALEHAAELARREPGKVGPVLMQVDAHIELGQYGEADALLDRVEREYGLALGGELSVLIRRARLARERGQVESERALYAEVLATAQRRYRSGHTLSWCHWQLGQTEFREGCYDAAASHHEDALAADARSWRALAGLARVHAAQGRHEEALQGYERAATLHDSASFAAARADVLEVLGRTGEAALARDRAEALAERHVHLDPAGKQHFGGEAEAGAYDRTLAMLWADRGVRLEEAHAIAAADYERRPDSHAAHALAWTALRSGRVDEAHRSAEAALRSGTREPLAWYHAALCFEAAGQPERARELLADLLARNPRFDPRRAAHAAEVLAELEALPR